MMLLNQKVIKIAKMTIKIKNKTYLISTWALKNPIPKSAVRTDNLQQKPKLKVNWQKKNEICGTAAKLIDKV